MEDLRYKHKWGLGDFLHVVLTAEPKERIGGRSRKIRAKLLYDSLSRTDVLDHLPRLPQKDLYIEELQTEFTNLRQTYASFGSFDENTNVNDIMLPEMLSQVQKTAPQTYHLLQELMRTSKSSGGTPQSKGGPISYICAIIAWARAPQGSTQLPYALGVHLHAMGVKRRVIDVASCFCRMMSLQLI